MANQEIQAVVGAFTQRINQALQGNNVAEDIQKAVWDMLKDLGIPAS